MLVSRGMISTQDAQSIIELTTPDDPPQKVAGLVAGELDITPREIESTLQGTTYAMSAYEVDEQMRSFTQSLEGWLENFNSFSEGVANWMAAPIGVVAAGLMAGSEALWGPEGYYGEESTLDRQDRARVRDNVRDQIDYLVAVGQMTSDQGDHLKAVAAHFDEGTYRDLFGELTDVISGMSPSEAPMEFWAQWALTAQDLRRRGNISLDPDAEGGVEVTAAEMTSEELWGIGPYSPGQGTVLADQVNQVLASTGSDFVTAGTARGLGGGAEGMTEAEIQDKLRQMQRPYVLSDILVSYGIDTIYDPSTGKRYTPDQWRAIMNPTDEAEERLREQYLTEKRLNPKVASILRKPIFGGRVPNAKPEMTWQYDPEVGRVVRRITKPGQIGSQPTIPREDLRVESLIPTAPWEVPAQRVYAGDGASEWLNTLSARERQMRVKYMYDKGLINQAQYEAGAGPLGSRNVMFAGIWEQATRIGFQQGQTPFDGLNIMGQQVLMNQLGEDSSRGYGGSSTPRYSVPASLREVPDYKALATETRSVFRPKLGRDMEDWELNLLADQLKEHYQRMRKEQIEAHRAAWEDAVAGGTVDVESVEVTNPAGALEYDIEESYAAELDRYQDVEDMAYNRNLLMNSITKGRLMI